MFKEAFEAHQALLPDDANSSLEGDMSKLDLNKSTDTNNEQDAEAAPPTQTGEGQEESVAKATDTVENASEPPPSCDGASSSSDSQHKSPAETKEEEDSK